MAIPEIQSIFPLNGFNQFPVGEQVSIYFDQEIDAASAAQAVFMYGPDFDIFTGPGLEQRLSGGSDPYESSLKSPGYSGEVQCEIRIYKVDENGNVLDDQHTYNPGELAYTKVTLCPLQILTPNTDYSIYIAGDGTSTNTVSVTSRSVFDVQNTATNVGDGYFLSSGVYTGDIDDVINVTMTHGGEAGVANYDWYKLSNPGTIYSEISYDGLSILFDEVEIEMLGSFETGDSFSFVVSPATYLPETVISKFSTGGNYVEDVPDGISTSPIGLDSTYTNTNLKFEVVGSNPACGESNMSLTTNRFVLEFSKDIDPDSVTSDSLSFIVQDVYGKNDEVPVPYSYIVTGNKIIIMLTEV